MLVILKGIQKYPRNNHVKFVTHCIFYQTEKDLQSCFGKIKEITKLGPRKKPQMG